MNLIKEGLLNWKKESFAKPDFSEGRVIVHDNIEVKGDLHHLLPARYSSALPTAIICSVSSVEESEFTLAINTIRIKLQWNMTIKPTLDVVFEENFITKINPSERIISVSAKSGRTVYLKFSSNDMFMTWHKAIREAIADMLFTQCFALSPIDHSLSMKRLDIGLRRGSLLLPPAHCHLLRARRLKGLKIDLTEILSRLAMDPKCLSREEVIAFLRRAEVDPLLAKDPHISHLRQLETTLKWQRELYPQLMKLAAGPVIKYSNKSGNEVLRPQFCSPAPATLPILKEVDLLSPSTTTAATNVIPLVHVNIKANLQKEIEVKLTMLRSPHTTPPQALPHHQKHNAAAYTKNTQDSTPCCVVLLGGQDEEERVYQDDYQSHLVSHVSSPDYDSSLAPAPLPLIDVVKEEQQEVEDEEGCENGSFYQQQDESVVYDGDDYQVNINEADDNQGDQSEEEEEDRREEEKTQVIVNMLVDYHTRLESSYDQADEYDGDEGQAPAEDQQTEVENEDQEYDAIQFTERENIVVTNADEDVKDADNDNEVIVLVDQSGSSTHSYDQLAEKEEEEKDVVDNDQHDHSEEEDSILFTTNNVSVIDHESVVATNTEEYKQQVQVEQEVNDKVEEAAYQLHSSSSHDIDLVIVQHKEEEEAVEVEFIQVQDEEVSMISAMLSPASPIALAPSPVPRVLKMITFADKCTMASPFPSPPHTPSPAPTTSNSKRGKESLQLKKEELSQIEEVISLLDQLTSAASSTTSVTATVGEEEMMKEVEIDLDLDLLFSHQSPPLLLEKQVSNPMMTIHTHDKQDSDNDENEECNIRHYGRNKVTNSRVALSPKSRSSTLSKQRDTVVGSSTSFFHPKLQSSSSFTTVKKQSSEDATAVKKRRRSSGQFSPMKSSLVEEGDENNHFPQNTVKAIMLPKMKDSSTSSLLDKPLPLPLEVFTDVDVVEEFEAVTAPAPAAREDVAYLRRLGRGKVIKSSNKQPVSAASAAIILMSIITAVVLTTIMQGGPFMPVGQAVDDLALSIAKPLLLLPSSPYSHTALKVYDSSQSLQGLVMKAPRHAKSLIKVMLVDRLKHAGEMIKTHLIVIFNVWLRGHAAYQGIMI